MGLKKRVPDVAFRLNSLFIHKKYTQTKKYKYMGEPIKQFEDDVVDIKKQSLYARLKRLFSTDVIVRNVGGKQIKIKDTDNIMYATDRNSLRDRFNRIRATSYNAYSRDFALSYQAARMDLFRDYDCVGPDTIIPLPDGSRPTIKELTEKYKDNPQERFFVFSYDHGGDSIKLGKAYHPRMKGPRIGFKVTLDNGQYVIGSIKHPFLMRNGEYKTIFDLKVGESVMPFNINDDRIYKCVNETEIGMFFVMSAALEGNYNVSPKIASIECIGEIEVYDMTVEEYHNFATDSCFVSNTMDQDPILASCLDIVADECLTLNELKEVIVIHSKNNNVKKILHNLYYDILNIEGNMWSWTRNLCKYGDFFLKLYITPEYGIYMVEPISPYNVERIENCDPYNKRYVKFQLRPTDTSQAEIVENYEMAHFRLLSDSNFLPYGKSYIEGARRVWKQLSLLEDAMLIHRVMRAPERRIFKIDVGNIPPNEVDSYMEKLISKVQKVPYMDERTGDYNLRFNLQNMVQDFYLPVRGGDSGTAIESLPGMEWTGIEDLDYVKNKMMAALKIPKAFLGYDESISGKSTLACIVPETKIPLLNEKISTVEELIKDYDAGIKNYVYAFDEATKNIVPGEIEWAGFTRMNTDIVRVHLDNSKYIDCTPDHRFMLRDGTWVEAQTLTQGQSLMSLCLSENIENHKVVRVEILSEKRDTCDITIKKHHNFATLAGVIIHNSEDVRFARTIQRLQRILTSELSKIAIVHLYAQGYRDEALVDFELELTNPSTIFEREKVEIWSDKVAVATDMMESKLYSKDWIYKNIFNMSDDDKTVVEDQIIEDTKQKYRLTSIEEEGNDPAKPAQKIGADEQDGGGESGGGSEGGSDLESLGGGPEGGEGEGGGEPGGGEGGGGELGGGAPGGLKEEKVQDRSDRDQSDRDQTGLKHSEDYPFGEDYDGRLGMKSKPGSDRRIQYKPRDVQFEGVRIKPTIDKGVLSNLKAFLEKPLLQEQIELREETEKTGKRKTLLDEGNIRDE